MKNIRQGMKKASVEAKKHWKESIEIVYDVAFKNKLDLYYSEIFVTYKHKIVGKDDYEFQTLFAGKKIIASPPKTEQALLRLAENKTPHGAWIPTKIETKNSNYSGQSIG